MISMNFEEGQCAARVALQALRGRSQRSERPAVLADALGGLIALPLCWSNFGSTQARITAFSNVLVVGVAVNEKWIQRSPLVHDSDRDDGRGMDAMAVIYRHDTSRGQSVARVALEQLTQPRRRTEPVNVLAEAIGNLIAVPLCWKNPESTKARIRGFFDVIAGGVFMDERSVQWCADQAQLAHGRYGSDGVSQDMVTFL